MIQPLIELSNPIQNNNEININSSIISNKEIANKAEYSGKMYQSIHFSILIIHIRWIKFENQRCWTEFYVKIQDSNLLLYRSKLVIK